MKIIFLTMFNSKYNVPRISIKRVTRSNLFNKTLIHLMFESRKTTATRNLLGHHGEQPEGSFILGLRTTSQVSLIPHFNPKS
jgi:hypothetical protein